MSFVVFILVCNLLQSSGANTPKATPLQSPGIETRVTNISSEPTEAVTATSPELTTVISKSAVPTVVDVQYNPPTSDVVPPVEAFENIKIESEGIENNSGAASDLAECDMSGKFTFFSFSVQIHHIGRSVHQPLSSLFRCEGLS